MNITNLSIAQAKSELLVKAGLGLREWDELLEALYQGPLEDVPWQSVLRMLAEKFGANTVTLILRQGGPREASLMINGGAIEGVYSESPGSSQTAMLDPFSTLPLRQVVTTEGLMGMAAWIASDLYKNFLRPIDVLHVLGVNIPTERGVSARLRVCRGHDKPAFSSRDIALCSVLLPHLEQSIRLHDRINLMDSERSLYAGTLDRMQIGMVVLGERGNLRHVNAEANAILRLRDGLHLQDGYLVASSAAENQRLQRLIRDALNRPAMEAPHLLQALSVPRPSGRMNWGVAVRAIPRSEWSGDGDRAAAAIFLRDPERKAAASQEALANLFGFTPMESNLSLQLANGLTLDEAAELLKIAKNTARAHLRSIFMKTGVSRQTMLVRVILNSIASLGIT